MWLRIGLFSESFPPVIDGVSNVAYNYARYIEQNHGESVVVTPKYRNAVDDYPFRVIRYDAVMPKKETAYSVGNPYDLKTLQKLQRQKFDLIHIHSPFASSLMAAMIAPQHKIPVVLTYHTKFDVDFEERMDVAVFRKVAMSFVMKNIRAADEVWAVSRGAGESLQKLGYEGSVRVVENGTDFPQGVSSAEELDALFGQTYRIAPGELVLAYIGRMMWYKNLALIIDSLAMAKRRGLKFRMFFVGDGTERQDIQAYAQKAGIMDCTVFTGAVSDRAELRKYYSRADLFLFPSTFDTSGIVVKEAAACRCPAILTRGSCAAEDITDGVNGFLAEENAESLCTQLMVAVADREKLHQVGVRAGEDIYLSWEDAVARGYHRYEEIVSEWREKKLNAR